LTENWRIENHQLTQNTAEDYFDNKLGIVEDKENILTRQFNDMGEIWQSS